VKQAVEDATECPGERTNDYPDGDVIGLCPDNVRNYGPCPGSKSCAKPSSFVPGRHGLGNICYGSDAFRIVIRYAALTWSLIESKHTMSHSSNSHKRRAAGYVLIVAGFPVFAANTLNITSSGFELIQFLLASTSVLLSVGLGSTW